MRVLQANISNTELLEMYGYEPLSNGSILSEEWRRITELWRPAVSPDIGRLRQVMLQIHLDLCPDDTRWR